MEERMFRNVIGFAILAVLAYVGLKIVFGLLGGLLSIALTILWLAFLGWVFYLILRVVSPETARKIRSAVSGKADAA
jgi:hypothetical protein